MNLVQPATRVLQPFTYPCTAKVGDIPFKGRPTVGMGIIHEGEMLFVYPTKGTHFSLPQGGGERHETLIDTAMREALDEIGLLPEYVMRDRDRKPKMIGQFVNQIPPGRSTAPAFKHLVYMLIQVWTREWLKLNNENKKAEWVGSSGHCQTILAGTAIARPRKYQALCDVVDCACQHGMIPWTSGTELVLH